MSWRFSGLHVQLILARRWVSCCGVARGTCAWSVYYLQKMVSCGEAACSADNRWKSNPQTAALRRIQAAQAQLRLCVGIWTAEGMWWSKERAVWRKCQTQPFCTLKQMNIVLAVQSFWVAIIRLSCRCLSAVQRSASRADRHLLQVIWTSTSYNPTSKDLNYPFKADTWYVRVWEFHDNVFTYHFQNRQMNRAFWYQ